MTKHQINNKKKANSHNFFKNLYYLLFIYNKINLKLLFNNSKNQKIIKEKRDLPFKYGTNYHPNFRHLVIVYSSNKILPTFEVYSLSS